MTDKKIIKRNFLSCIKAKRTKLYKKPGRVIFNNQFGDSHDLNFSQSVSIQKMNQEKKIKNLNGHSDSLRKLHKYCIVKWLDESTFSIFSLLNVKIDNSYEVLIDNVYEVYYGDKIFLARVKFIGTKLDCENEFRELNDYTLKKKEVITRTNTKNLTTSEKICKSIPFEKNDEKIFNEKIKELELNIEIQRSKISNLNIQIHQKDKIIDSYKKTLDHKQIEKILEFSINFFKLYGSHSYFLSIPFYNEEVKNNLFLLSLNYPNIKISNELKNEVDATIKNQFKSDTACFRKLIGNMINDNSAWAERNRAKMLIDYSDYIHSAYEYIKSMRQNFDYKKMENEITKICAEARRTVKKCQHEKTSPPLPKPTLLRNTIQTSQLGKTNKSTSLDSSHSIDEINSKARSNQNSSNTEGSVSESLYSNKPPCFKRRRIINMDSDFE